jgi:hypothetical protein
MDAGITRGVFELDVIAGLMLLDEGVLQEKGLDLGVGDDIVHCLYGLHQGRCSGAVILFLKIIADTLLDISGFADVDDVACIARAIQEEVAPGQMRERIQGIEGDHVLKPKY